MKTELKELKRIKVLSLAKVFLIFGLIMGLLQGISYGYAAQQAVILYPQISTMSVADAQTAGGMQAVQMVILVKIGWWSILIMPIVYGIFSWIGGVISAWLYNIIARKFGGVKLTLE